MNAKSEIPLDDDSRFDRLVDGALSAAEYKSLRASLEDEPSGWRRCALAFLEAQAWRREFAAIRRPEEDALRAKDEQLAELRPAARSKLHFLGPLLAAAACALLAFGLGLLTQIRFLHPEQPSNQLAAQPATGNGASPDPDLKVADLTADPEFVEMNLVIDGAGNEKVVVPVIASRSGNETLVETEPVIPDSVLRSLRLRGHRIEREQQFIPVATGDGRHVIFPVEQYHITPVSSRSY